MRSDVDDWDVNHSVGATALFVAAGRALANRLPKPIIHDPFADDLVNKSFHPIIQTRDVTALPGAAALALHGLSGFMSLRTYAIDQAILNHPTDQLVILASGLDARAWRLPLPASTTVYEIDREQVIAYKNEVINATGAQLAVKRVPISADLRYDWLSSLTEAGLDLSQPITWVTEGLLPYLPKEVQLSLANTILTRSAPGSRWISDFSDALRLQAMQENKLYLGVTSSLGIDIADLVYVDNPPTREELYHGKEKGENLATLAERIGFEAPHPEFTAEQQEQLRTVFAGTEYDNEDAGFLDNMWDRYFMHGITGLDSYYIYVANI